MKERTNYLILVLCEDVSAEDLDEEMRPYMRTNTYLRRDSRWFWEKLRYAIPQKTLLELQRNHNLPQNADWSGVHAIARAQQAESTILRGGERPNINIHRDNRRQNRGKINERLTGCEMDDYIPQGRDDIPLVENARYYAYTWMSVAQLNMYMSDKVGNLVAVVKGKMRSHSAEVHFVVIYTFVFRNPGHIDRTLFTNMIQLQSQHG